MGPQRNHNKDDDAEGKHRYDDEYLRPLVWRMLMLLVVLTLITVATVLGASVYQHNALHRNSNSSDDDDTERNTSGRVVVEPPIEISVPIDGCRNFLDRAARPGTRFITSTVPYVWDAPNATSLPPIPRIIHFIHAYEDVRIRPQHLCTIESALRQNPDHVVRVAATNAGPLRAHLEPWIARLVELGTLTSHDANTRFLIEEIDHEASFRSTPLHVWYKNGKHRNSKWIAQNLGNALRLALVHGHGGVYLDLDILSVNPVGSLGRSTVLEVPISLNNAVLSFIKGDGFLWSLMKDFVLRFNGYKWAWNGPHLVSRMYRLHCRAFPRYPKIAWMRNREQQFGKRAIYDNDEWIAWRTSSELKHIQRGKEGSEGGKGSLTLWGGRRLWPRGESKHMALNGGRIKKFNHTGRNEGLCRNLGVAPVETFFPLPDANRYILYQDAEKYCDMLDDISNSSIGFHYWNSQMLGDVERNITDRLFPVRSVLVFALKAHCPGVFSLYSDQEFGIS